MAGRALAFSDPKVIALAREFVPVTGDDWYQRRREDDEGQFFRSVADQGPQKGDGGSTRQGVYCLTPKGKLLGFKNAGQIPEATYELMRQSLAAWKKLPAEDRKPFEIKPPVKVDSRYQRSLPSNGLVCRVFTRALDRSEQKWFIDANCQLGGGDEAGRDHLWIRSNELAGWLKPDLKRGDRLAFPPVIFRRILRFHLVDNTRGEPPFWLPEEIREDQLSAVVEESSPQGIRLRLEGKALLSTDPQIANSSRGYDAALFGYMVYQPASQTVSEFELVAVGDHWGAGPHTRKARPGRTPLGIYFSKIVPTRGADQIPPQAAREIGAYYAP